MTPYDLQSISTLQLVYEGKLKDYLDQDIYENERVSFRFIPIKL